MTEMTPKKVRNNFQSGEDTHGSFAQTLGGVIWRLISRNTTSVLFGMLVKIDQKTFTITVT